MMEATSELRMRWCPACHSAYRSDFARCPIDGNVLSEADTDPLLGQTIGQHYVIDELLGEGAMARVYRAHHALLEHRQFALKVMIGDLAATLEMRLRFAQEADAASQLDHPNVVSVVDFGKTDTGLMYLAMELIEGRSLATVIAEEAPLAPARALALARQICLGLGHAHDRGLVHRDLKPENIIISGEPELARIVDFGLAIPVDDERSTRLTSVGLVVGTPLYASPEQTHNEPVDHRADLFALGVTLYEMLAGVTPFQGGLADVLRQNASDVMTPIEARSGVQVPAVIEDIVRGLTRRDPTARFASARAVVEVIDAVSSAPLAVVTLPAAPARRSRVAWIAGAGVIAATIAVMTYMVTRAPPAPPPVAVAAAAPPLPASARRVEPSTTVAVPEARSTVVEPSIRAPMRAPTPTRATPRRAVVPAPPAVVKRSVDPVAPPAPLAPLAPLAANDAGSSLTDETRRPAPTPEPVVPPAPKPPADPPLWTTATTGIAALRVRGPLSDADVRRAVERGFPAVRSCYQRAARAAGRSPAATVRVSLSFDDSRRATSVTAIAPGWNELAACVRSAAEQLRVQVAPDVGTADVVVDLVFQPVSP